MPTGGTDSPTQWVHNVASVLIKYTLIQCYDVVFNIHYYYSNLSWRTVSRQVDISRSEFHTRRVASSLMRKILKYLRDVVLCVGSSYWLHWWFVNYIHFLKRNSIFKRNNDRAFALPAVFFINVNVISLVLRDSDTDSENVSLIRRSVSNSQKTCSSTGVSLIGI